MNSDITNGAGRPGEIRSGTLGQPNMIENYRSEWLGEILVERAIWGDQTEPQRLGEAIIADRGYVWFRFWLPVHKQIVERYYAPDGALAGTLIDVSTPPAFSHETGCRAQDLLLDIWIDPEGFVRVLHEAEFEAAAQAQALTPEEVSQAEERVRTLTGAIARGLFPPALVRRWEIDVDLIRQAPADAR